MDGRRRTLAATLCAPSLHKNTYTYKLLCLLEGLDFDFPLPCHLHVYFWQPGTMTKQATCLSGFSGPGQGLLSALFSGTFPVFPPSSFLPSITSKDTFLKTPSAGRKVVACKKQDRTPSCLTGRPGLAWLSPFLTMAGGVAGMPTTW